MSQRGSFSSIQDIREIDKDEEAARVFTPKATINRTPPTGGESRTKKRKDDRGRQEEEERELEEEEEDNRTHSPDITDEEDNNKEGEEWEEEAEKKIRDIKLSLNKIKMATSRELNSKIQFNKSDQQAVREEADKIKDNVVEYLLTMAKVQRENWVLRAKLEEAGASRKEDGRKDPTGFALLRDEIRRETQERQKEMDTIKSLIESLKRDNGTGVLQGSKVEGQISYAKVVGTREGAARAAIVEGTQQEDSGAEKKIWTTPVQNRRYEAIIRPREAIRADETWKKIKEAVKGKQMEGGVRNVIRREDGSIKISCKSREQADNIEDAIKGKDDLQVRLSKELKPLLKITGVTKGYEVS